MKSKEISRALRLIAEGFTVLADVYDEGTVDTSVNITGVAKEEPKGVIEEQEVVVEVKEEVVQATQETETITQEYLQSLSYNELKALAKTKGAKAVGSKVSIIEGILAIVSPKEETVEEEVVETISEPEIVVDEVEEAYSEVEEEVEEYDEEESVPVEEIEEENKTFYDQVVADLEGYSDEELADVLSDIGISPKGGRQALLSKVVQAIEDGLIEWEDEEEPKTEEVVETVDTIEEIEEEPTVTTSARKYAQEREADRLYELVENGDVSHNEIVKFLKSYYNDQYTSLGVKENIDEYVAIHCDLIDDEGEKHDMSEPYYVGDDVWCCSQKLKQIGDDYFCEICGTTYTN